MKFKILTNYANAHGDEAPWWEEYDKDIDDALTWAQEIIIYFNETLRPHERPRKLLDVAILDDASEDRI